MAAALKLVILGDSSGAVKALNETNDAVSKTEKSTGGAFGNMKGMVAGAFAGIGVGVLVDGIGKAITAASDLNEVTSKTEAIFGDWTIDIEQFAEGAAKGLGLSKTAAMDAADTFAVFGKAAGLSGGDLTKFSTDLVTLSADMASFSNTSPEQSIEAIGAALRGESEPIRAYGVMLDDATIKARAMSMGLVQASSNQAQIAKAQVDARKAQLAYNEAVKAHGPASMEAQEANAKLGLAQQSLQKATEGTIPDLNAQQKALAVQGEIMAQTADQQGDFAKTSGGWAGQQKILAAEMENMTTELGQKLLPIAVSFMHWIMESAIPTLQEWWGNFQNGIAVLQEWWGWFQTGWAIVQPILAEIGSNIALVATAVADAIGTIIGWIRNVIDVIVGLAQTTAERIGDVLSWFGDLVETVEGIPDKIKSALGGVWDGFMNAAKTAFNFIADAWNNTVGKISFTIPDWVPVIGGKSFDVPDIPHFGTGGIVWGPTLAIVGERGPELITPLSGSGLAGVTNITVNVQHSGLGATSPAIARDVAAALRTYERTNGRVRAR